MRGIRQLDHLLYSGNIALDSSNLFSACRRESRQKRIRRGKIISRLIMEDSMSKIYFSAIAGLLLLPGMALAQNVEFVGSIDLPD